MELGKPMAKQATRLSDFHIPRSEVHVDDTKVPAEVSAGLEAIQPVQPVPTLRQTVALQQAPEHEIFPIRIAPRPLAEPRQALTVRLPVSMHERVRMLMFTSRRSQQDIVEEALDTFLKVNQA